MVYGHESAHKHSKLSWIDGHHGMGIFCHIISKHVGGSLSLPAMQDWDTWDVCCMLPDVLCHYLCLPSHESTCFTIVCCMLRVWKWVPYKLFPSICLKFLKATFSFLTKKNLHMVDSIFCTLPPYSAEWSKETTDWSWQEGGNSHFHFGAINRINRDPADNAKKKSCCSLQWRVLRASELMWKENTQQQLLPFLCCSTIITMCYKFVHFFFVHTDVQNCLSWYKLAKLWFNFF